MQEISSNSVQYVRFQVGSPTGHDPSSDVVSIAFTPGGRPPVTGDWTTAEWEPSSTYVARVLIGPSHTALTPGVYGTYVKVTDNPETPVISGGFIRVT